MEFKLKNISAEEQERLAKVSLAFINEIVEIIKKAWEQVKKFFIDNREIFKKYLNMVEKKEKYKKRVRNRQALYLRRGALGRSF